MSLTLIYHSYFPPNLVLTNSPCVLWFLSLQISHRFPTRLFISEAVVKHAASSTFCSVVEENVCLNDESALRIGSCMADVHAPLGGRLASWLCSETPYLFQFSLLPRCTFEDGAHNCSVLTRANLRKQVSQTVGQR